jgi:NAD(P)-dependent dehydrogenase (short-subunit alcohol dehydrogenase family)
MMAARRTVFVTGASQGIGAEVAVAFAREGYDVAVSSQRVERLADVLSKIEAAGARAVPVELDLKSHASIERSLAGAAAGLGAVDVLVNNAAVALKKSALETTPQEWDDVMGPNLTGTFFISQRMGRYLKDQKRPGCIINMASTHGLVSMEARAAYGIAKAGVIHMTRTLAFEWASLGIRVNAIAPGRANTPSREATLLDPKFKEFALSRVPMRRFAEPDEVAAAAIYLASPQASYITGHTLVLDGGLTTY